MYSYSINGNLLHHKVYNIPQILHVIKEKKMGNRAVITTEDKRLGVYLHWNGGRNSIEAFLKYCKINNIRPPESDCYGWARLCQVIGNFFGGTLSVGIDLYENLDTDNTDNGVYIIRNWKIVGREFNPLTEQTGNLEEQLECIKNSMPDSYKNPSTLVQ